MRCSTLIALVVVAGSLPTSSATAGQREFVFVKDGVPKLVRAKGKAWARGKGYIECSGADNYLYATKSLEGGDFHIKARLSLGKLGNTAATFDVNDTSRFGFEGDELDLFVAGPLFGPFKHIGKVADFFKEGKPFLFEVVRKSNQVSFLIDGKEAIKVPFSGAYFGQIDFRPWRSVMRIYDWSASGNLEDAPPRRTQPTTYSIPVIGLSGQTRRQVVVERKPGQYLGHPTTVLMGDG